VTRPLTVRLRRFDSKRNVCLCIDCDHTVQPDQREPAVPSCNAADCHQWRCNRCTYVNADDDFWCRMCRNPSWSDNAVEDSEVPVEAFDPGPFRSCSPLPPTHRLTGVSPLQVRLPPRYSRNSESSSEQWTPEDCEMPSWPCDHCTNENCAWNNECETCYST